MTSVLKVKFFLWWTLFWAPSSETNPKIKEKHHVDSIKLISLMHHRNIYRKWNSNKLIEITFPFPANSTFYEGEKCVNLVVSNINKTSNQNKILTLCCSSRWQINFPAFFFSYSQSHLTLIGLSEIVRFSYLSYSRFLFKMWIALMWRHVKREEKKADRLRSHNWNIFTAKLSVKRGIFRRCWQLYAVCRSFQFVL